MIHAENSNDFCRPTLLISRCLNQDNCRYNAQVLEDQILSKLEAYIDFKFVCPEVEIGMSTPRPPIRIIRNGEGLDLVQPLSGISFYESMAHFSRSRLNAFKNIDGFIMKARSPSCGLLNTPYYAGVDGDEISGHGSGIFTDIAEQLFPNLAFTDEDHLRKQGYASTFFTVCFASAKLRDLNISLEEFHREYVSLLRLKDESCIAILENHVESDSREQYKNLALSILKTNQSHNRSGKMQKKAMEALFEKGGSFKPFPAALEKVWT